jgi:hypothetical protein
LPRGGRLLTHKLALTCLKIKLVNGRAKVGGVAVRVPIGGQDVSLRWKSILKAPPTIPELTVCDFGRPSS